MTILNEYRSAKQEYEEFVKSHAKTVARFLELQNSLKEAEESVKNIVKSERKDFSVDNVTFVFSPAYKKWFDYHAAVDAIKHGNSDVDVHMQKLRDITSVVYEVNFDELTKMCREGEMPNYVREQAYREDETLRVTKKVA